MSTFERHLQGLMIFSKLYNVEIASKKGRIWVRLQIGTELDDKDLTELDELGWQSECGYDWSLYET